MAETIEAEEVVENTDLVETGPTSDSEQGTAIYRSKC